jgi:DNA-binding MarR family transcriptional regulator/GNAT superfamily N-acetyltransferase
MTVPDERVDMVRAFNRSYTEVIGVLGEGMVRTSYSLTEARVLFELAQRGVAEVADLRQATGIDAGYLSRILTRFQVHGLVERERSAADGRRQVIRLTDGGRGTFGMLDERAAEQIRELLARLTEEEQRRLVNAMTVIQDVVGRAPRPDAYLLRPLRPGDLGWVVQRHGVRYAEEYGWDDSFEALVARIVADYVDNRDPRRDNAWIAEVDGEAVGCVFCVRNSDQAAQLRLLLVEPRARGLGIGGRLVEECIRFARRAGYGEITLWTNDVLADARRVYQRAGFTLVDEQPHHSFGHDLVGQHWSLTLR